MSTQALRNLAIATFIISMVILLTGGYLARSQVPPIPHHVVSGGKEITGHDAIMRGQDVYQRYGLMDHGSVWGHGTLRGMDFSAHTLHCTGVLVKQFLDTGKGDPDAYLPIAASAQPGGRSPA